MSGSALTPFLVPIIIVGLAIWLGLIFYADAHPQRAAGKQLKEPTPTSADVAPPPVSREIGRVKETTAPEHRAA
jgi:hypothetical protein